MLNIHTLWVLALTEMRSSRRLFRTWLVIGIALTVCIGWYVSSLDTNLNPSAPSGWDHYYMNARFKIAEMMNVFVATFSCGLIFLAFDVRARDVHNRIHEIVDSLPANNVEIVVGRLIGILLLLLFPVFLLIGLIACYETMTELFGGRYRVGTHPISVATLFVWGILPNLVFFSALVACLATLVRNRMVVAILALGVLVGSLWVEGYIPVILRQSLSPYVASVLFPSDLTPTFATFAIATSRIATVLMSVALLLWAAAMLPRIEPRRRIIGRLSVALFGVGALTLIGSLLTAQSTTILKDRWAGWHEEHLDAVFADVQHIEGSVDIRPGRFINLDVTLTVATPRTNTENPFVFSLNPGYKIKQVYLDSEIFTDYSFKKGLLVFPADAFPNNLHKIRLVTRGRPDDRFAYLDQVRDFQTLADENVPKLGLKSSIFRSDYVALMPGIVWYPISGVAIDRDNLEKQARDLFTSELIVTVPRDWHVAMTGARETVEDQNRNYFKFENDAPLPELALFTAAFEQHMTTIDGIVIAVLYSERHRKYLEALTPVVDQLQKWTSKHLSIARAHSLRYPYKTFYVVEVPSSLRIYRGGWQMDSVLQPPGMMLIRETTLPTVDLDALVRGLQYRDYDRLDGQYDIRFLALWHYISNDMQGGNPFVGISRNFVSHQISATGRGATALQYLLDELSNQLIVGYESCFVVSITEFGDYVHGMGLGSSWSDYMDSNYAKRRRMSVSGLPSTWNILERTTLFDLDYRSNPIYSYRALSSKVHALAKSMIAHYGAESVGRFLETLRADYEGKSFTFEDFVETASLVDIDLGDWVLPWLEDTAVPGYLATSPTVSKRTDQDFGDTTYQSSFILYNAEPTSGYVQVFWSDNEENFSWYSHEETKKSNLIFLEGHTALRFAIQSNRPLTGLRVEPVLALNRMPIDLLLPIEYESVQEHSSTLPFITEVTWPLQEAESIIVDDLDPTFSIVPLSEDSEEELIARIQSRVATGDGEFDHGLLFESYPQPGEWCRLYHPTSYGHYRRSYARIAHGDQTSAARFVASIPYEGTWQLDFFLPKPAFYHGAFGGWSELFGIRFDDDSISKRPANQDAPDEYYRLEIDDGNSSWNEQFDVANAKEGWNLVGFFDLSSKEVEVLLSDYAGHRDIMVHADAIRWTPVSHTPQSAESSP